MFDLSALLGGASNVTYQLHVVTADVHEAVMGVGGWLLDRAVGGWDVTVMLADHSDYRPLHILGAKAMELRPGVDPWEQCRYPHVVAASSGLLGRDSEIRQAIARVLESGCTDVVVWRSPQGIESNPAGEVIRHRLSRAAREFKAHALAACGGEVTDAVDESEVFRFCGVDDVELLSRRGGCRERSVVDLAFDSADEALVGTGFNRAARHSPAQG